MRRNEGSVLIWLSLLTEPGLSYSMDNRAFPSAGFISADESMFAEEHCMPANCQYPLRNYRRSYLMKTNKYTRVDKRIPHQHLRDLFIDIRASWALQIFSTSSSSLTLPAWTRSSRWPPSLRRLSPLKRRKYQLTRSHAAVMPTATASSHDEHQTSYLFDHYSSSLATVSLSLYIIILPPALVIHPVFVRDICPNLPQLTDIMYHVICNFGGQ